MGGEGSGINTHNIQDYGGGLDFTTGGWWYSNILTQIPSQVKGKGWIYNVKVCILCYVHVYCIYVGFQLDSSHVDFINLTHVRKDILSAF